MAYSKIKPIKIGTHLTNILNYIQNPKKTNEKIFTYSYMCSTEFASTEFESIRENAIKKGNNVAHHICQSFSPEDDIKPEQALEIGKKLMELMYPNHQYVMATHIDKGHIHNHIVVNAVSFENYRKINSNIESLNKMRNISDELCRQNGLSVIKPITVNHREELKKTIDKAVENSNTFDEFLSFMQSQNYEIKQGKHLSFRGENDERFMRISSLGTAYSDGMLRRRIEENKVVKNSNRKIYDDKTRFTSGRKRLRFVVNNALDKAKNFNEFLQMLENEEYEIKKGKHLAFRQKGGKRFMRIDSLGEEYTEEMLRLRLEDFDEYERLKQEIADSRIDKVSSSHSSYVVANNITMRVKTLHFLRENNITSIDEINAMIEKSERVNLKEKKQISELKQEVSARYDIINAVKNYWQYKSYGDKVRSIKDVSSKESYIADHKIILDKLQTSINIMNKAKELYGELPKSDKLYSEINNINQEIEKLSDNNSKTYKELTNLRNIKYNVEEANYTINNDVEKEEKTKANYHKKRR